MTGRPCSSSLFALQESGFGHNPEPRISRILRHPDSQSPGEVLHELPCDSSRTRAAGCRRFQRFTVHRLAGMPNFVMGDVAVDHGEEFILAATVEAEPQAEAIGQR